MSALLQIDRLSVIYHINGYALPALQEVDLHLAAGEKLGLVGESGAGKTTLAGAVMGLLPRGATVKGKIIFKGKILSPAHFARLRGREMVLIPQNVYNSLNPVLSIGQQMEDLQIEGKIPREKRQATMLNLLQKVRLPRPQAVPGSYPHQLSGGMKQRVLLAMGLSRSPSLVLADEPTKGLDPVRRMGILSLVRELMDRNGQSLVLITHDLNAAVYLCDTVALMYRGELVEIIPASRLLTAGLHPYTRALLAAAPERGLGIPARVDGPPSPFPLHGCPYSPLCELCLPACRKEKPPLFPVGHGHLVRCGQIA